MFQPSGPGHVLSTTDEIWANTTTSESGVESNPMSNKKVKGDHNLTVGLLRNLVFKNWFLKTRPLRGLLILCPPPPAPSPPPPWTPRLPRPPLLHRPQPLRAELIGNSSLILHPDSYCQGWPGYPLQCIEAMGAAELPHGLVPLVALPRAWTPPPWWQMTLQTATSLPTRLSMIHKVNYENIHIVANQFISQLLKIWQYIGKDSVVVCDTALLFVIVLLFVKTHNVCGLTIHGPIGMQRRLCGRDTAQPMKNNTCKN